MKQRVTLYLDSDTWKMIRIYCVSQNISASQFVENILHLRMMDTDIPERLRFGPIDSQIDSHMGDEKKNESG